MIALLLPLAALFAGVALLLAGSGLLGTLLALRGSAQGFGTQTLGLVMSGYFVGFFLGTWLAPPLIRRLGHIRAFSFLAALCAAAILLHPIWPRPSAWFLLRAVTGIGLVGLYTVIESWLGAQAQPQQRGRVLAAYMAISLVALALGQQLLRLGAVEDHALFSLVAILVCLAVLPVTATRVSQPTVPPAPRLGLRMLLDRVPTALAGALLSGLAMGAFWGLGPVYAERLGADAVAAAGFMTVAILGGALLQWPLGRLSDRGDRRTTLSAVAAVAAVLALAALPLADLGTIHLVVSFLFGGVAFSIYPISVAHLLDRLEPEALLSGCSGLLLAYGAGAMIGPVLAGWAMSRLGPGALPGWWALVFGILASVALARRVWRGRARVRAARFHLLLRTTPTAMGLLPEHAEHAGGHETAAPAAGLR